ncbi:MAG: peptide-methionine (S)-S-oxide reductase MsrA [Candidatus Saccharibacteria bacterium]
MEQAIFAAGCFWGIQFYFDQVPGVIKTTVGYTGGHTENPSYEDVCSHTTGHAEATLIEFDPKDVTYEELLIHLFRIHDPTQLNRQGPDIGDSYRSAIFYTNDNQRQIAEDYISQISMSIENKEPIVTEVTKLAKFYEAEDYHQKYTERTGRGMCHVAYEPIKQ